MPEREPCDKAKVDNGKFINCCWPKKKARGECFDPPCHKLYRIAPTKSAAEKAVDAILHDNTL